MISAPLVWRKTMADAIKILRVCAADGGARLLITVEYPSDGVLQREHLAVFASRLDRAPIPGEISHGELELLQGEDTLGKCLAAGLRSLSAGGCSCRHLVQKLRAKGFSEPVAREATEELARRGYLQESESAVREAERGMLKLWGNKRILMDLRAKGYGNKALEAASARLRDEDAVARCCHFLRKKRLNAIPDEAGLQKLIAALLRYGYTQAEVRAALQQHFG